MLIIKKLIFTALLTLNWFKKYIFYLILRIFHRCQSKSFLDPQVSISNRFRHVRVLSPSQTLCPTVFEGHGQSETDEARLNRSNQVRRPRVNMSVCCHVEDPWMKIESKRFQMFCKRLHVVLTLIVCEMIFSRTQSSLTPPNSKKWVIEINLTVWSCYKPSLTNNFF